jgi:F-type H+-transporting ATPase subunit b
VGPGGDFHSTPEGGFSAYYFATGTPFVYRTTKAVIDIIWFDTATNALLELDVLQSIITPSKCNSRACKRGSVCDTKELSKRLRPIPFMDQILNQLGELVLGSVPTIVLFLLLVFAYGMLVRRPLDKVLAERRARTSGAVEQARSAIAAAETETSQYEDKLRHAKNEIFQLRDQKLKQWNAERDAELEKVRQATQEKIKAARQDIEQSASAARVQIEGMSAELSAQVLRAVLPAGISAPEVTQ